MARSIMDSLIKTGRVERGYLGALIQNLIDWSTEDTDLLAIRTSGAFARTLRPLEEGEAGTWEAGQYALSLALLLSVGLRPVRRRRNATPIPLPEA